MAIGARRHDVVMLVVFIRFELAKSTGLISAILEQ